MMNKRDTLHHEIKFGWFLAGVNASLMMVMGLREDMGLALFHLVVVCLLVGVTEYAERRGR